MNSTKWSYGFLMINELNILDKIIQNKEDPKARERNIQKENKIIAIFKIVYLGKSLLHQKINTEII